MRSLKDFRYISLFFAVGIFFSAAIYSGRTTYQTLKATRFQPTLANQAEEPVPVCGTPSIPYAPKAVSPVPQYERKVSTIDDTVGQVRTFYAWDDSMKKYHEVNARLLRIGKYSRIYVDTTESASSEAIQTLSQEFDQVIYPLCTEVFGQEPKPGIDGDTLITILLYDIRDVNYYDSTKTIFIAGYFSHANQESRQTSPYSNEREMVYVDIRTLEKQTPQTLGTLAHEFQHLIQYNQDRLEASWVNEGLSELAIWICGYPRRSPYRFLNEPDRSLTKFDRMPEDYDKSYLFFMYLYDKYGGRETIRAISTSNLHGENGIEAGLQAVGKSETFKSIFSNWVLANYLDADDGSPYGYSNLDLPSIGLSNVFTALPVEKQEESVKYYAADYYEFRGGEDLSIVVDGNDFTPDFLARVVKFDDQGGVAIESIPLDDKNKGFIEIPEFGNTVKRVALVITHANFSPATTDYVFWAGGQGANTEAVELFFDDGRPVGYFPLKPQDTLFVAFDGQQGMALDSVRMKFFTRGQAEFHIWRPREGGLPGRDLIQPMKLTVTKTATQVNNYEPWETIILGEHFIDISKVFLVGLVMGSTAPDPKVGVDSAYTPPPRSIVYLTNDEGVGQWYLSSGDFLIRAYISPIINDFTTPELTVGVLQHPVFTENLDVYIFSPKALNPQSVKGKLIIDGSEQPLTFDPLEGDMRLFQNQEVVLDRAGTVTIVAEAMHARGNVVGRDTLTFTTVRAGKHTAAVLASRDRRIQIDLPAGSVPRETWMTLIPAERVRSFRSREPELEIEGYRILERRFIGPEGVRFSMPVNLQWEVGRENLANAFIMRVGADPKKMPTYRGEGYVTAWIRETGEYALVVAKTGEENNPLSIPKDFVLLQNYPNPFNPETTIRFALRERQRVSLHIYDIRGRKVRTLLQNAELAPGWHEMIWDARDDAGRPVASGVYLYQLKGRGFDLKKKMTLLQ